jgi:hypothetical protein
MKPVLAGRRLLACRNVGLLLLAGLLTAVTAGAQVVSQWRAACGIPVAVVELAGGDFEHFAALVPSDAALPDRVADVATTSATVAGGVVWSAAVPAVQAGVAVDTVVTALGNGGASAVVAVGPVPLRELAGGLQQLDGVAWRPLQKLPCELPDGGLDVQRGSPDAIRLSFAAPSPEDSMVAALPAVAEWLQGRLTGRFAGARVSCELAGSCERLVVEVPDPRGRPRRTLDALRHAVRQALVKPPTDDEAEGLESGLRRRRAAAVVDGGELAVSLSQLLARDGQASSVIFAGSLDPATLSGVARLVLADHAGYATIVEGERRSLAEGPENLDNGVVITWRWLPDERAAVAVAVSGVEHTVAQAVLEGAMHKAAGEGWTARAREVAGVETLVLSLPSAELVGGLEMLTDALAAPAPAAGPSDIDQALGLAPAVDAESLSVAVALPGEDDEGAEAARKFFGGIARGELRSGAPRAAPGLHWTEAPPPGRITALVELPADLPGWLAGEVLSARLAQQGGVRTSWYAPPGGPLLAIVAGGGDSLPVLDGALAKTWKSVRGPATAAEVSAAAARITKTLYGDLAETVVRAAATPFLPASPPLEAVLAASPDEVDQVLAALPPWEGLLRLASGPPPEVATPPVRKSHPSQRPRSPGGGIS